MNLAALAASLEGNQDLAVIDQAYLHRCVREDMFGQVHGRDQLKSHILQQLALAPAGKARVIHDLGDLVVVESPGGWLSHHWGVWQGDRILRETVIVDGTIRARALGLGIEDEAIRLGAAMRVHAPLGELRPGRGQLAMPDQPDLTANFPQGAGTAAGYLHRFWNHRSFAAAAAQWRGPDGADDQRQFAKRLLSALPDAVLMIERATVAGDKVAILWRLHGHHLGDGLGTPPTGKRVRAIGSSVLAVEEGRVASEDMLIDMLAVRAQLHAAPIDYTG